LAFLATGYPYRDLNMVASEKQKNINPSTDMTFYIVGRKRLQNDLIASCLKRDCGGECFVVEDIGQVLVGAQKDFIKQRLVLYCCDGKDLKDVLAEIEDYTQKKPASNRVVLFNVPSDWKFKKKFVSNGIQGFFYERDPLDIFLKGVGAVLDGKLWLSRDIMTRFILEDTDKDKFLRKDSDNLTERQTEIIALIAVGATNDEIADRLCISPHTVKTHLYRIFKKINVPNRVQAALWAAKNL
jgi:DNA-binding NarL/FixJ family response regulator